MCRGIRETCHASVTYVYSATWLGHLRLAFFLDLVALMCDKIVCNFLVQELINRTGLS